MLSHAPGAGLWGPQLSGGWHGGGISLEISREEIPAFVCVGGWGGGVQLFRRLGLSNRKTGDRGWGAVLECPLRFSKEPPAFDRGSWPGALWSSFCPEAQVPCFFSPGGRWVGRAPPCPFLTGTLDRAGWG